ncbi:hypothetical protein CCACVL1_19062 [Corchorus capsularis]|uniref:Uncharacterized protein n=1 Tax=Corchorus capsularis TaxID=210143 RepID=A0A1R3HIN9_COCAP|nr:hypothetical protein CCACVL1_19062 [Corchorus capsularis]
MVGRIIARAEFNHNIYFPLQLFQQDGVF